MKKEILARLRILSSDEIFPFEWSPDTPRKNSSALTGNSHLHHPFLITPLGDVGYLLLGDTGLFETLVGCGAGHLPVEICRPEDISLRDVRLGLVDFHQNDLLRLAAARPDQVLLKLPGEEGGKGSDFTVLNFEFSDAPACNVYLRGAGQNGCPASLACVFHAILRVGRYLPIVEHRYNPQCLTKTAAFSGFVSLPPFTLDDLKGAVSTGRLLPPHVVGVRTSRRILSIDYPIAVLGSPISADEKEVFLRELIALREQNGRTSFYDGPVFVLNR